MPSIQITVLLKNVKEIKEDIARVTRAMASIADAKAGYFVWTLSSGSSLPGMERDLSALKHDLEGVLLECEARLAAAQAKCLHLVTRYVGMDGDKTSLHVCEDCGKEILSNREADATS